MAQGLFRNGWAELGRKWDRRKLQKQLAEHDRTRATLLGKLGETAWQTGADLSAHAALRDPLLTLEGRAGEIAAHAKALDTQRQGLEERRKAENAKFDAQRAAVEAKKQPVDAQLAAARQRQAQHETTIRGLQERLQSFTQVLETLRSRVATLNATSAPDSEAQIAAASQRIAEVEAEQPQVAGQLRQANEALSPILAEVRRHYEESQKFAAEIERIEGERRKVVQGIDAELNNLRAQMQSTGQSAQAVGQDRGTKLVELGGALYQSKSADPKLAEAMNAVAAEDKRRAATQAAFDSSIAQTQALPSGTVPKFLAAMLALVLVVLALPVGGYWAWDWWRNRPVEEVYVEKPPINPYLDHQLKGEAAYVLANRLADAKTDKEAQAVLLELFRTIGLGVYTHDGKKVQAGAERSAKDFFLYDFQLRILARAQVRPSYFEFPAFAHILGEGVAGLEQPAEMERVLREAMVRRYQQAGTNPKERSNFLVLFLDGLARRQPIPYSLSDMLLRGDHTVSPVQTVLILLEFFMKPMPPRTSGSWLPQSWNLVPSVHAQDPCSLIQGDQAQSNFGQGSDILGQIAEQVPGMVGKVAGAIGNATGVIGAAGDLLLLYGLQINLEPQPEVIHLRHDDASNAAILANVTFDPQGVPDSVLRCGWLAGKQMPVKGPVKDVEIRWRFAPQLPPELVVHPEMYSLLIATNEGFRTKTNEGGDSIFLLQPGNCPDRQGDLRRKKYTVQVRARVITTSVPTPGIGLGMGFFLKFGPGIIEYIMGGRTAYANFQAEWHKRKPDRPQYSQ